ncbi:HWE histidine kinase domain-containing protein [Corticibacterium sp. UT-5YL-CI-8]|nr:HWE histidine kinase domain-containing protein [Tianweitania sp. UT-5YL-CI-8]
MSEPVNLTNCDREPIHIPGSIQPHGCMLVCDVNAVTVLRHSANAPEMLGLGGVVNGTVLQDILGSEAAHSLRNGLSSFSDASRPALLFDVPLSSGKRFDIAVHRFKSTVIIEFELAQKPGRALRLTRELIGRISNIDSVDRLLSQSARLVRAMLGYDRVMIYRFEQDGSGKVVSEVKRADLESFLGQYFPASDIPQQARALYMRNTIRIISDADAARIPIVPVLDASGEALDLSFAHLRSVSPIHCEYLRNMGVAASMSISIIVEGRLWGLIACHHYAPRVLPMAERVAAEMFGEFFSLHLHTLKQKRTLGMASDARKALDNFLRLASHHTDVDELLRENLGDFMRLMPCDGVGLWMNAAWSAQGITAPADAIPELARLVGAVSEGRIWATHALSQKLPAAQDYHELTAGVLAIPLSQIPNDYLFFFRREMVQTLNWAGNPDKSYGTGPLGDRLTPRKSFAIWKETVSMQAQPWTEADREIAEAARAATVEVVLRHNELMAEERSKSDVRQRMLNAELNHRVKNILAIIKSLVGHPIQEGRSLKDYVHSLKGRIQALSFAHDQIVRGDGGGLLADLINAELSPYRGPSSEIVLVGPTVWLDGRAFSVMALILHEMATNAAKYGALSRSGGKLVVSWTLTSLGDCELSWVESGGPAVTVPEREGFGTALIDRSIPYDLGGESSVDYAPGGIKAHFRLPARHISLATAVSQAQQLSPAAETGLSALPSDMAVLLVEDQMLIAMDVEAMLEEKGVNDVTVTSSSQEALTRLRSFKPHVAVLDFNLGQGTSIPVAQDLTRRGIPFLFATGYGDGSVIPAEFSAVPIVRKPYDGETLLAAIARLLSR